MEPRFEHGFTLQEALEMAYAENIDEIFMEPPDADNMLTDEDSGDEDGGGAVDNLPGSQLRARAEVILADKTRIGETEFVSNNLDKPSSNSHMNTVYEEPDWIQGDIEMPNRQFSKSNYDQYKDLSTTEIFELFFDDDVISLLVAEIGKYALFKNCVDPNVTKEDIKCFIGILLLSGYNELPGKRYYWDTEEDMRNILVYNSMKRDRFLQISRFLHCADNTKPDNTDKIWKIRPLMDKIKSTCMQHFHPEQQLCYDESMVKYYGRHSCKQFIRGKPIRFGYKMWSLNTSSGYLVNFEIYQGNSPRRSEEYEKSFGKAAAPLVTMLDELQAMNKYSPYHIYFDNLFTGSKLLRHLKEKGYQGTGTIRQNRLPRNIPLTETAVMKKKPRGTYESIIDRNNGIIYTRWVDNGIVTVASTCHGVQPVGNVRRYSQAEKKVIQVSRPNVVGKYNSFMGGTDLMDENLALHRIGIRGKKWWWCLFSWLIDVCVHNAWQLKRNAGDNMKQITFRREIVTTYLRRYGSAPKGAGRPSTSRTSITLNRISDDLRYDRKDHLVVPVPDRKRRRCAGEGCISSVRTMCNKCGVGLCIDCFLIFHTK